MVYQTNTILLTVLLLVKSCLAAVIGDKKKFGYFNSSITSSKNNFAPYTADILSNSHYTTVCGSVYSISTLSGSAFSSVSLISSAHTSVTNFSSSEIRSTAVALSSEKNPSLSFEVLIQSAGGIKSSANNELHLAIGSSSGIAGVQSSIIPTTGYTTIPDIIDETITVDTTKIKTITSCLHDLCDTKKIYTFDAISDSSTTFVSTYFLSTLQKTVENTITEYTTWCPLVGSSSNDQESPSTTASSPTSSPTSSSTSFSTSTSASSSFLSNTDSTSVSSRSTPISHETSDVISKSLEVAETNTLGVSSSVKSFSFLSSATTSSSIPTSTITLSPHITASDNAISATLKSSVVTSSTPSLSSTSSSVEIFSTDATSIGKASETLTKAAPVLITINTTKILTITSCFNDKCNTKQYYTFENTDQFSTFVSTYVLSTSTLTVDNVVTEYTTWCPLSETSHSITQSTDSGSSLSSTKQQQTTLALTTTTSTSTVSLHATSLVGSCTICTTPTTINATNVVSTSVTSINVSKQFIAEASSSQELETEVTSAGYSVYTTTEEGIVTQYTTYCPLKSIKTDSSESTNSTSVISNKVSNAVLATISAETAGTTTAKILAIETTTETPVTQSSVETTSASITVELGSTTFVSKEVNSKITSSASVQTLQGLSSKIGYSSSLFTSISSTLYSYSVIEPTEKEALSTALAMQTQSLDFSSFFSATTLESIATEYTGGGSLAHKRSTLVVAFGLILNIFFI